MVQIIKYSSTRTGSLYPHSCSDMSVHNKALRHVGILFIQGFIDAILSAAINLAPRESSIFKDSRYANKME